jgi:hypothetical protein
VRRLVAELELRASGFEAAQAAWEAAAESVQASSESLDKASEAYRLAARNYRIASYIVVGAAAMDSVGLSQCDNTVSTAAYRRALRAEGLNIDGKDIDHLWPRSLGGADHPWNYQVLDASLNRSLGNNVWRKFVAQPLGVIQGAVVSALAALGCG